MKIEDRPVSRANRSEHLQDFLICIRDLEVGQSFFVEGMHSSYRIILGSTMILLGKKFATQKDGNGFRIGRIS